MGQFKPITVWRCLACKRILTTKKGIETHKEKCKFRTKPMNGQIDFDGNIFVKTDLSIKKTPYAERR